MQLSKVVSLLKRFGCPMEAPCRNRNFAPKFCLSEPYIQTVGAPMRLQCEYRAQKGKILVQNRDFCTELPSDAQTFLGAKQPYEVASFHVVVSS